MSDEVRRGRFHFSLRRLWRRDEDHSAPLEVHSDKTSLAKDSGIFAPSQLAEKVGLFQELICSDLPLASSVQSNNTATPYALGGDNNDSPIDESKDIPPQIRVNSQSLSNSSVLSSGANAGNGSSSRDIRGLGPDTPPSNFSPSSPSSSSGPETLLGQDLQSTIIHRPKCAARLTVLPRESQNGYHSAWPHDWPSSSPENEGLKFEPSPTEEQTFGNIYPESAFGMNFGPGSLSCK